MAERTHSPAAPDTLVVDDLATLRAMSHPLRMRMIELMSRGEWTVKQAAAALGVSQTRLYRHVAILESHGLLRVTGTRVVSGITEKRYAAPPRLTVEPRLFGGDAEPGDMAAGVDGLVATAFATIRSEIGRAIEAREAAGSADEAERESIMLTFDDARLPRRDADEFGRRLQQLAAEFESRKSSEPATPEPGEAAEATGTDASAGLSRYRLFIGFYRSGE